MTPRSNLLSDLARTKALFQQRAMTAALGIWPAGSKPGQEPPVEQNTAEKIGETQ